MVGDGGDHRPLPSPMDPPLVRIEQSGTVKAAMWIQGCRLHCKNLGHFWLTLVQLSAQCATAMHTHLHSC